MKKKYSRKAALAVVGMATAGLSVAGAGTALADTLPPQTDGTVAVTPTSGTLSGSAITLTTSGPCLDSADATNILVTATGAGFSGQNVVGNAPQSLFAQTPQGGYIIPLGNTVSNIAKAQGVTLAPGSLTFDVQCIDSFADDFGGFLGSITVGSDANAYAALPEAPLAIGLPIAALALGGVVVFRRRRSATIGGVAL